MYFYSSLVIYAVFNLSVHIQLNQFLYFYYSVFIRRWMQTGNRKLIIKYFQPENVYLYFNLE